jgi:hypothetical protein
MRAYAYSSAPTTGVFSQQRKVTLNIVHSMISTVVSKIIKNNPRPTFLTAGGDFSLKRKAKQLNKFSQGLFYESNLYEVGEDVSRDACIFGTGFMKIYQENNKVKAERVLPDEIIIDDEESIYGKPRQMFHRKFVSREVLIEMFPEAKEAIIAASEEHNESSKLESKSSNQVACLEAWHLPSNPEAKDGRHVIAIDNRTLVDEEYGKSYFPFVVVKWNKRPLGLWGQGIAEQLTGLQVEINKLLRTIQVSMHLVSVPKVFVEAGSKVSKSHLNNEIGGVIVYSGTMPEYRTAPAVNPEMFAHLDRLYNRAYEIVGISQLSATSKKPSGLDSGRALREFHDIESERFMSFAKAYEKMYLDAAKIMIDTARDIEADGEGLKVTSFNKKFVEKIDWKDINLDESDYVMQAYPTSLLPSTPAGKLQTVEEMLGAGLIAREDALNLLEFPDLESVQSLQNAPMDDIEMTIGLILDKGEYVSPEPFSNLPLAIQKMNSALLRAKVDGAPEDKLELLRRYISDALSLLNMQQEEDMAKEEMMIAKQQAEEAAMQEEAAVQEAPPEEQMMAPPEGPPIA